MAYWRDITLIWSLFLLPRFVYADHVLLLTEHLPPYQIVQQGSITGSATEITEAVFNHAKVEYELSASSWSDAYNIALRNHNVCLFSTSRIPQRESNFVWIGQINSMNTVLYRSVNDDFHVNTLEEAKNFKVAAIKDDVTHHFLLSQGFEENKNLYVLHTYDSLVELLDRSSRHIDFVVSTPELLKYRVKDKHKLSRYEQVLQVDELVLYHYLACNLNAPPQVVDRLRESFAILEERGDLQSIRQKWGINTMQAWTGTQIQIKDPLASLHHLAR